MGARVVISELGDDPPSAIEQFASLEPMEPPEPGPGDVVIAVKSEAVGWVDLLMSSGQYQLGGRQRPTHSSYCKHVQVDPGARHVVMRDGEISVDVS
jgi:hypothetical protein